MIGSWCYLNFQHYSGLRILENKCSRGLKLGARSLEGRGINAHHQFPNCKRHCGQKLISRNHTLKIVFCQSGKLFVFFFLNGF